MHFLIHCRHAFTWGKKRSVIMRINLLVLFMAGVLCQVSASSYGQKITLHKRNARLVNIFKDIQQQSGYDFVYSNRLLKQAHEVTIQVKDAPLQEVLNTCFKGQPFFYTISDKTIVIRERKPAAVDSAVIRFIDISGRVTDAKGQPLAGASISIKGLSGGAVADADGRFTVKNVNETSILVVSFTGYKTKEVRVNESSPLVIVLEDDLDPMSQVVIVGYGSVQRRDLTGAVSRLTSKDIENRPVTRVDQMLQGRMAGVDVKSVNGAPGSGTTIRIRGARSINANNEPLYVVDGLIDPANNLNSLNPEDIESIDVLKDASAAAIYGSRGANGVVLITTKKGKANTDISNFNVIAGVQSLPRTLDLMNARQFAEFINESRKDQNRAPIYSNIDSIVNLVGEDGTNWTKEVTGAAPYQSFNLSTSGGTKKLTYFLSGNVINQDGIVKNTGFRKYQARININKTFSDKLNMGLVLNASRHRQDLGNVNYGANSGWIGSMITLPPTMRVRKADGSWESYNPVYYSGGDMDTPPVVAELTEYYDVVNSLQGNLFLELQLLKGLKIKSAIGTSLSNNRLNYFQPGNMPSKIAAKTETANASSTLGNNTFLQNENTITYDRAFGQHHINVVAGFTNEVRTYDGTGISVSGLTDDILRYNNFESAPQDKRTTTSKYENNTRLSYLGRANYNYAGKYYLTVTSRYDGSSNFARDHKWGFFPSFGAKWRISEEDFFKNLNKKEIINNLAFRFSYGRSGNQGINNYQSLASLNANPSSYVFGGNQQLGYTQGLLANNDLTWETSDQMDIGADVELFNGRLVFDANYYHTKTRDLLLNVQIPTQTGFGSRLINLGKTASKGFEFLVSGDIIRTKNFTWNSTLTVSTNEQQIIDMGPLVKVSVDNNGYGANTNYLEVGVPIGANYGVDYKGVWHNQAEIDAELAKPKGERTMVSPSGFYKPGKPRYEDRNGDGLLNVDDYHYLGTPNPKVYGGLGNRFTYKNISLDFFFQYNYGNTMYNAIEFFMGAGAEFTNQFAYMANRWTPANPESDIPAVNSRDNVPSSRFLHDASLLRLKSLQLSYSFRNVLPKVFKKTDLYFTGSNLFLLTKYNGFDPEVNKENTNSQIRAKDDGTYPNARTLAIGVNLGF
jgi:TonB-linked SusC/RagA family outer membrane protein